MNTIVRMFENAIFYLHPIKRNNVVFMSYDGQYCDSPKEISTCLLKKQVHCHQVWIVSNKAKYEFDTSIKVVKYGTLRARYYLATAKVIVDNVFGGNILEIHEHNKKYKYEIKKIFCHRKKKQKVFSTWHGTPIKKMGPDQVGNDLIDWWGENITLLLDNDYTMDIMKRYTFNKVQVYKIGAPRNDRLFSIDNDKVKELKKRAGIDEGKKVVVFAPTFRSKNGIISDTDVENSGLKQMQMIDIHLLLNSLKNKFGGEWVFVCRFHYHVEKMVNWEELSEKSQGMVINGNLLDEMSDYLYIADALISDVSSCMYDYAITRKPCFIFFPDYVHYKEEERGFYQEIKELPFPFSDTFEGLLGNINDFVGENYKIKIGELEEQLGYIRNSNSAESVTDFIISHGLN